jgi:hypothetical protein
MRVSGDAVAGLLLIAGCAEQSATRIANDTVRVNVSTAPIYGALEPERRAMLQAAEETLESGFDKFLIVDGQSQFKRNVIANHPGYISATPSQPPPWWRRA